MLVVWGWLFVLKHLLLSRRLSLAFHGYLRLVPLILLLHVLKVWLDRPAVFNAHGLGEGWPWPMPICCAVLVLGICGDHGVQSRLHHLIRVISFVSPT